MIAHLSETDLVFCNHRCHGHFLCKNEDPVGLLAEIMGKAGGICGGRGGSQFLLLGAFTRTAFKEVFCPTL